MYLTVYCTVHYMMFCTEFCIEVWCRVLYYFDALIYKLIRIEKCTSCVSLFASPLVCNTVYAGITYSIQILLINTGICLKLALEEQL